MQLQNSTVVPAKQHNMRFLANTRPQLSLHVIKTSKRRRDFHVARTADFPLGEDGAAAGDVSKCPFINQLRTPPMLDLPWLKRVQFQVRSWHTPAGIATRPAQQCWRCGPHPHVNA